MIKRIFIVICTFLGLSCGSDNSADLTTRIENKLGQALKSLNQQIMHFSFRCFIMTLA
jgi:hypothetical protein